MNPVRVIGLGNTMAGDDGVGVLIARRLNAAQEDRASIIEAELASIEVLDLMQGAEMVILLDAAKSGAPPGTIHRYDLSTGPCTRTLFPHSTHAFHAMDAVELARTLGMLPPKVVIYAVEASAYGPGQGLSPPVEHAMIDVLTRIHHELETAAHA